MIYRRGWATSCPDGTPGDADELVDAGAAGARPDGNIAMGRQAPLRRGASGGVLDQPECELRHGSRWEIRLD